MFHFMISPTKHRPIKHIRKTPFCLMSIRVDLDDWSCTDFIMCLEDDLSGDLRRHATPGASSPEQNNTAGQAVVTTEQSEALTAAPGPLSLGHSQVGLFLLFQKRLITFLLRGTNLKKRLSIFIRYTG